MITKMSQIGRQTMHLLIKSGNAAGPTLYKLNSVVFLLTTYN